VLRRGIDPAEVVLDEGGGLGISPSKGRIDGSKPSGGFAKLRGSLDLGEGVRELTLKQRKNPWSSHIGESGLVSVRIACTSNPRSAIPDLIGTVDSWRDRWHESGVSGIRQSGTLAAKDLESWVPRSAKSRSGRGRVGPRRRSGVQVACSRDIGVSALGKLRGQGPRSEWGQPEVDFDRRAFGNCSPGDSTANLAIPRGPISR
jgi:hypothetical protein